jgi:hypothetical protein
MKKLLYLVLTLIALLLLYLRFSYGEAGEQLPTPSPNNPVDTPSPSPAPVVELTEKLDNIYFSLSYNKSATTSSSRLPDSREWVISYMGEDQKKSGRTQTELWDGYVVVITQFEVVGDDPEKNQAELDRQGTIDACGEENATPIKTGKIGKYDTLTYYGGCLGAGDYHYLMMADYLYRITVMTPGSEQLKPQYESVVNAMINSLSFK